jgi:hypothetical protein
MHESWLNLLWRIPVTAFCFTLAAYLVQVFIEINEVNGLKFETLGFAYPIFFLLLVGAIAISPTFPKPFFHAMGHFITHQWHHWIG